MPTSIIFANPPPAGSSIVVYLGFKTSRFTRVFRVNYPMVPLPPSQVTTFLTPQAAAVGDVTHPVVSVALPTNFDRNIYGVQIDKGPLQLSAPQNITLVSDQPGDTRNAAIYGYDGLGNVLTEILQLNGLTPVTSVNVYEFLGWVNILDY